MKCPPRRYIDLASDIIPGNPPQYGGRVCITWDGSGCAICLDELDLEEAQRDLAGPLGDEERRKIYGMDAEGLNAVGPSVVSVNGVVASVAVTEFMVAVTGLRAPKPLLTYRGNVGKVMTPGPDSGLPKPNCYYCSYVRSIGQAADVERYIREEVGGFLH